MCRRSGRWRRRRKGVEVIINQLFRGVIAGVSGWCHRLCYESAPDRERRRLGEWPARRRRLARGLARSGAVQ